MKKIILNIIKLIIIITLGIVIFITFNGFILYKNAIKEKSISDRVNEIRSNEHFTSINNVNDNYINAVIAIEDHRFFYHFGVDIFTTLRAAATDIISKNLVAGGSSITQQVAKNLCFSQEKVFSRKVAELFVVYELEKNYSKEEIFEIYMNSIYFGNGYYNIYDASMGYYNKLPSKLTLYEATMLAGVPNAPSVYAPTVNLNLAEKRQTVVLNKMIKYGYLSQEEADAVINKQKSN